MAQLAVLEIGVANFRSEHNVHVNLGQGLRHSRNLMKIVKWVLGKGIGACNCRTRPLGVLSNRSAVRADGCVPSQGAYATLGYVVKPLRGKGCLSAAILQFECREDAAR
jgi:hypothetical protein